LFNTVLPLPTFADDLLKNGVIPGAGPSGEVAFGGEPRPDLALVVVTVALLLKELEVHPVVTVSLQGPKLYG